VAKVVLGKDNPVFPGTLTDLQDADFIIILGPNGSGKTSLLSPFRKPGSMGRVYGLDAEHRAEELTSSTQYQSLAFIASQALMEKVQNLRDAIALASNSPRVQQESTVLQLCVRQLESSGGPQSDEPPILRQLQRTYLDLDARCGGIRRTTETYNALGRKLASACGRHWNGFEPRPDLAVSLEASLVPAFAGVRGFQECAVSLQRLIGFARDTDTLGSPAQRLRSAHEQLTRAVDESCTRYRLTSVGGCPAVVSQLEHKKQVTQELIDATDRLSACRRAALKYLAGISQESRAPCPVCAQDMHVSQVLTRLSEQGQHEGSGADQETADLRALIVEIDRSLHLLQSRSADHARCLQNALEHSEKSKQILQSVLSRLTPADGWDPWFCDALADLRVEIERWLVAHSDATTAEAERQFGQIATLAGGIDDEGQLRERRLRNDHEPLLRDFDQFQRLGCLLRARHELNAVVYRLDVGRHEADLRRRQQLARWTQLIARMAEERRVQAETDRSQALDTPEAQRAFQRLVASFAEVDPWLAGLRYDGSEDGRKNPYLRSVDPGESVLKLSEGQTVVVNLGAALTVAGVLARAGSGVPWVVLDEPTNALDQTSSNAVADYLGSVTMCELPCQIFVSTFDEGFAIRLRERATRAGRTVRLVRLNYHERGGIPSERRLRIAGIETYPPQHP